MTGGGDPLDAIRESFFLECEELLEALQDGLATIDANGTDVETINQVFRSVHSIKGGAGAFGLDALVGFAHVYETVLDMIRGEDLNADAEVLQTCFSAADVLTDLVRSAQGSLDPSEVNSEPVLEKLNALAGDSAEAEEEVEFQPMTLSLDLEDSDPPQNEFRFRFTPSADLYASGNEPLFLLKSLNRLGQAIVSVETENVPPLTAWEDDAANLTWVIQLTTEEERDKVEEVFEFVADVCSLEFGVPDDDIQNTAGDLVPDASSSMIDAEPPSPPSGQPEPQAKAQTAPQATVRVELEKIDKLMNLVGELVINQAMLSQSVTAAGLPANSEIAQGLDEFMQLTRNIQDSVMTIRAQPVKPLFQRMSRIVREASSTLGKSVKLNCEGESTEVDKTVIERLSEPLTHMIRNAVDHGLEDTDERIAAGKDATGVVTLQAAHQSGRVLINIQDDGRGINRDKVKAKAIANGLIAENAILSNAEIDNLLFMPGFSTAGEVSALSGRGVGMDVVKTAIQALGGRISIQSNIGVGTCFTISLPLTLAVLDGMIVSVGEETFVMPLGSIVETMILDRSNLKEISPNNLVVTVRGGFAPLIDLGVALGFRSPKADYVGDIVLVVASENGRQSTIVVDSIRDQRQVVIKGLQSSFGNVNGIAAATILGDGKIALILDPIDLAKAMGPSGRPNDLHMMEAS